VFDRSNITETAVVKGCYCMALVEDTGSDGGRGNEAG